MGTQHDEVAATLDERQQAIYDRKAEADARRDANRNLARSNAADAKALLEAFRNPEDADSSPAALLGAAVLSTEAAVRYTLSPEHGSPAWIVTRLLLDAGRMLELLGTDGVDEQRTAERYAQRYLPVV